MYTNYYDSFENQLRHENSEVIEIMEAIKQGVISKINKNSDTEFYNLREFRQTQNAVDMATHEINELKKVPYVKQIFQFNDKYPSFNKQSLAKFYEGVTIN